MSMASCWAGRRIRSRGDCCRSMRKCSAKPAPHVTMNDVFEAMMPYIEEQLARGTRLHSIVRHFVGAFFGVPGARAFRRHLAEYGVRPGAGRRRAARCRSR